MQLSLKRMEESIIREVNCGKYNTWAIRGELENTERTRGIKIKTRGVAKVEGVKFSVDTE